jgi:LPS sulfotransferase NodH
MTAATKTFILLFTPRSGSSLIAADLAANGCGTGTELFHKIDGYFHPEDLELLSEPIPYSEIATVIERYSCDGVFGFKMSYIQMVEFIDRYSKAQSIDATTEDGRRKVFASVFADLRLIVVRRRDVLLQAISLVKAKVTGQWDSRQDSANIEDRLEPIRVRNGTIAQLAEIQREQLFLERAAQSLGVPIMYVTYEEYLEVREPTLCELVRFVRGADTAVEEASPSQDKVLLVEHFKQQSTDENKKWEKMVSDFMMSRSYIEFMMT